MTEAKIHIVRKTPEWLRRLKIMVRFPHIWTCFIIIFAAVATLLMSLYFDRCGNSFWSSILANVFAGLITGFVICLISGVKQITIVQMRAKKAWLENLATMLKKYFADYDQLLKLRFNKFDGNEELFNFIYDAGSHANWINDEIIQSSFDKTLPFKALKYSKDYLEYDAVALSDAFERLHVNLQMLDVACPSSTEIIRYFHEVNPELKKLNYLVYNALRDLDVRLSEIQKTIV